MNVPFAGVGTENIPDHGTTVGDGVPDAPLLIWQVGALEYLRIGGDRYE